MHWLKSGKAAFVHGCISRFQVLAKQLAVEQGRFRPVALSEFPHTTAAPTATARTGATLPLAGTLPATALPMRTLRVWRGEGFWCWMTWRVDNVWVKRDRSQLPMLRMFGIGHCFCY